MDLGIAREALIAAGLDKTHADTIYNAIDALPEQDAATNWSVISRDILTPEIPFKIHEFLYLAVFNEWDDDARPRPAWTPTSDEFARTHIADTCADLGVADYAELHNWSITDREGFWEDFIERIGVEFKETPRAVADMSDGDESPLWLPGGSLNIADSCFMAEGAQVAIVYQAEGGEMQRMTYAELDALTNRFANSLSTVGLGKGDAIAIAMPMTIEAVVAYLGIVKAGGAVVSIADSFAPDEIATRLRIAGARAAVTSDVVLRAGKTLPMYQKVVDAGAEIAIVVPAGDELQTELRESDREWSAFLVDDERFDSIACHPGDASNILFSSGTTGDPKAIPWSHTTPVKCAMDGFYHHDIHAGEVVAWPTNIGWMMGPWLIYASLVNRATMALYYGTPNSREFCEFVQNARVNMLGLVPSLAKAWRATGATDGLDWSAIRCFSSTGEASNPDDYLWLMSRARYKPIVEYCGGTEIGGGFITQALVQPASPSCFSTQALGNNFYILDENAQPTSNGELYLVPPTIGLSLQLLNRDHHDTYYKGTPKGPGGELLRRHGDQMEALPGGYFRIHGRTDDTMNLGGIKVSSAEIERVANRVDGVSETAAIAVDPRGGGPSQLVIYSVMKGSAAPERDALRKSLQSAISSALNPLFRVHDVVVVDTLPRTASNKVMRRVLRDQYAG